MCNGSPLSVNPIFHFGWEIICQKFVVSNCFLVGSRLISIPFRKKVSYLFVFCANEQMENSIKGMKKSHISVFLMEYQM
jgi:hypothetical protein